MARNKLLIIEDERPLAEVLSYNLRREGYEVLVAHDGQEGLRQAELKAPDLVILDLMLPVIEGLEVCRRLRAEPRTRRIPILVLTAKAEETDQVVGFSMGADDYVTKPFSVKVVVERVKALLRRSEISPSDQEVIESQGVTVDRRRHKALVNDRELELTPTEFRLLETLLQQAGRAFTRGELMDCAISQHTVVLERTIDVHVKSLRQKMGESAPLIETVRGIGYRFREPNLASSRHRT